MRRTTRQVDQLIYDHLPLLQQQRICLLAGGKSKERRASLATARAVKPVLSRFGLTFEEIDPANLEELRRVQDFTLVFNALHGRFGEDGKIQGFLDTLGIPYTGPGVLASALGMHKLAFKRFVGGLGIPTPAFQVLGQAKIRRRLTLTYPVLAKPVAEGGSIGIFFLVSPEKLALVLPEIKGSPDEYYLEEFVQGQIVTVGILEINGESIVLPPLEIVVLTGKLFYDQQAKYEDGYSSYQRLGSPGSTGSSRMIEVLSEASRRIWQESHCQGSMRVDFVVSDESFYALEMNTLPGLYPGSNLATAARWAGISFPKLVLLTLLNGFLAEHKY